MRDGINTLADWCDRDIRVISITQGLDFNGTVGKMIAAVLLAVAEMERENISENIRRGQAAARAAGKTWGGSQKGRRLKVTNEQLEAIFSMKAEGEKITCIARTVNLHRSILLTIEFSRFRVMYLLAGKTITLGPARNFRVFSASLYDIICRGCYHIRHRQKNVSNEDDI